VEPGGWWNLVVGGTWWLVEPGGWLNLVVGLEPGVWWNLVGDDINSIYS
jgi:hypothetical protein